MRPTNKTQLIPTFFTMLLTGLFFADLAMAQDSMVILPSGNVGVNTANPSSKLDVISTPGDAKIAEFSGNKDFALVSFQNNRSASVNHYAGVELRARTSSRYRAGTQLLTRFSETDDATRTSEFQVWNNDNGSFSRSMVVQGKKFLLGGLTTISAGNELEHSNGAALTSGGVWQSVSSRKSKMGIADLQSEEAIQTLESLNPVRFRYKLEPEEEYLGFIAEDVPNLVATSSRQAVTTMDIVSVITRVVKDQQQVIENQNEEIENQRALLEKMNAKIDILEEILN